jgi:hypothetical protein
VQDVDFVGRVEEGRCFLRIAEFWYGILQMKQELSKCCYDWQIGNLKWKSWAASLREELYKTGQLYILQNGKD